MANKPFWGVQGAYTRAGDPWAQPALHSLRRIFYAKALQWLSQGGGPTYPIAACFVWNKASWDVMGIHPGK